MTTSTRSRLKFAFLMTICGLAIELAAVASISPATFGRIPWILQAATGLIFFYLVAPWATIHVFKRMRE